MKRTFVFLLLGPILGLFGATLNEVVARGGFHWEFGEGAAMALIFSVIVSAVTAPVDGYFAHALPLPLRVPFDCHRRGNDSSRPDSRFGQQNVAARCADAVHDHRRTCHGHLFTALAQLTSHVVVKDWLVINHLTSPLNVSFTLPQPKGALLIAP